MPKYSREVDGCRSFYATIHMAGDIDDARRVIREFTKIGACVQLAPCQYVYTGGMEDGFTARIMQYPRFPRIEKVICDMAVELGDLLSFHLCQASYSVETRDRVSYFQSTEIEKK